jgi:hypothetical protein
VKYLTIFFLLVAQFSYADTYQSILNELNSLAIGTDKLTSQDKMIKLNHLAKSASSLEANDPNRYVVEGAIQYSYIFAIPIEEQMKDGAKKRKNIFLQTNEYIRHGLSLEKYPDVVISQSLLRGISRIGSSELIIAANELYLQRESSIEAKDEIEIIGQSSIHLIKLGKKDEAVNLNRNLINKYPSQKDMISQRIEYFESKE